MSTFGRIKGISLIINSNLSLGSKNPFDWIIWSVFAVPSQIKPRAEDPTINPLKIFAINIGWSRKELFDSVANKFKI